VALSAAVAFLTSGSLPSSTRRSSAGADELQRPLLSPSPVDIVKDPTAETIARLQALFTVSRGQLRQIVSHMVSEMQKGLEDDSHSLRMIPTHVVRRPTGHETGSYLAMDLGGSNFRVCEVVLEGNGVARTRQRKFVVPDAVKTGPGRALFDYLADAVAGFLVEIGADLLAPRKLGFTFSFAIRQTAINQGYLLLWNKGFSASSVVGSDVVALLQAALDRRGLKVTVTALVNDTTGTLISHCYSKPNTYVGVILGTGTNAAYIERSENIVKFRDRVPTGEMVINTEWGA
ncbi:glucokinase, partial [Cladochytrium tenue]